MVVNYLHDTRVEAKVPFDQVYGSIFYSLAGMLVVGLIANLLVRPVAANRFMTDAELAREMQLAQDRQQASAAAANGPVGPGGGGVSSPLAVAIAWFVVVVPLCYGIWMTLLKAATLFR